MDLLGLLKKVNVKSSLVIMNVGVCVWVCKCVNNYEKNTDSNSARKKYTHIYI